MERKIQKSYVDKGFGFPVYLTNVPMVKVRGQWTPDIHYGKLADTLLLALAKKPARLTGNELRFIRTKFELTLKVFGLLFDVTHPAVMKWEKAGDQATQMSWSTEKDIRLFILERDADEASFLEAYQRLRTKAPEKTRRTIVDLAEFEPAIA